MHQSLLGSISNFKSVDCMAVYNFCIYCADCWIFNRLFTVVWRRRRGSSDSVGFSMALRGVSINDETRCSTCSTFSLRFHSLFNGCNIITLISFEKRLWCHCYHSTNGFCPRASFTGSRWIFLEPYPLSFPVSNR